MSATSTRSSRPLIAFTSGDPAGIGPEVAVKALRSKRVQAACRVLVVGEKTVWKRAGWTPSLAPLYDTGLSLKPPVFGCSTAATGKASFAAFETAVQLSRARVVDGLVTAPVSKRAWGKAGIPYRDHTEYLVQATGSPAEMILASPSRGLWCVLATRHIPLSQVPGELTVKGILDAVRSLRTGLMRVGVAQPRLILCGLNPHAGEDGLLGKEEKRVLIPAAKHADLPPPIAADAAWRMHAQGRCDGLVCLYHDQALIGLKAAAGLSIVNWTAGLPFVRTSPGHGTGFDIAGKNKAASCAMEEAALLAARLAR